MLTETVQTCLLVHLSVRNNSLLLPLRRLPGCSEFLTAPAPHAVLLSAAAPRHNPASHQPRLPLPRPGYGFNLQNLMTEVFVVSLFPRDSAVLSPADTSPPRPTASLQAGHVRRESPSPAQRRDGHGEEQRTWLFQTDLP